MHLVVELSAEEVQNHGGDGPGNILPVTSKKERKKNGTPEYMTSGYATILQRQEMENGHSPKKRGRRRKKKLKFV